MLLRVAIAGMVHGHVEGFLQHSLHRSDIQIVGVAEPDRQVAARYAAQFNLDRALFFTIWKTCWNSPASRSAYTNTYDHRKVVEMCARYHISVMMKSPWRSAPRMRMPSPMPRAKPKSRCW